MKSLRQETGQVAPRAGAPAAIGAGLAVRAPRKRRAWVWWLLALGAVAYVAVRWAGGQASVVVAPAEVSELLGTFTAEGFVRGREYPLAPEVPGRVTVVMVDEGDSVSAGQVLYRLDASETRANLEQTSAAERSARAVEQQAMVHERLSREQSAARISGARSALQQAEARQRQVLSGARREELAQMEQRVRRAEASLQEAQRAFARAQELYDAGAIPRAQLEVAEARSRTSEADANEARQALALMRAGARPEEREAAAAAVRIARAELDIALSSRREIEARQEAVRAARAHVAEAAAAVSRVRSMLAKLDVRSPVDGIVSRRDIQPGMYASPAMPAIVVVTREDLHVEAEISSEDAAKVQQGMSVAVTSPTYPARVFPAKVVRVAPVGELKPDAAIRTRIVRTRVELDADQELLRPGMEVDVQGQRVLKRALAVPNEALGFSGSRATVFVVDAQGVARERAVETGFSTASKTEVVAGLSEGERVIVEGGEDLKDGSRVRVAR